MNLCLYRTSVVTQDKIYWHLIFPLKSSPFSLISLYSGDLKQHLCCLALPPAQQGCSNSPEGDRPQKQKLSSSGTPPARPPQPPPGKVFKEDQHIPDTLYLKEETLSEAFWGFRFFSFCTLLPTGNQNVPLAFLHRLHTQAPSLEYVLCP